MKVALVYDRVNKFGGAERLLLQLKEVFPQAPLYTLVYNPSTAAWAGSFQVVPSFFNHLKSLRTRHQLLAPLAPLAFESFNFDSFDLVISLTSESAKAVITKPSTLHICYCLTPTRYLWSASNQYQKNPSLGPLSPLAGASLRLFLPYLRRRDLVFSHRPDHYLAISRTVQQRVKRYYKQPSKVIYPPVDYQFFSVKPEQKQDFYLLVSRLEPYKKASLAVKAFANLPQKTLKIVGTGSQAKKLKKQATSNVHFLGHVNDQKLRSLYSQAQALIFPQQEDFGLTPLEAQSAGTPVLAFNQGGASETVINGQTGLLFKNQTPSAIIKTINRFEQTTLSAKHCQNQARQFTPNKFQIQIKQTTKKLWQAQKTHS